jgi:hypothetical protein
MARTCTVCTHAKRDEIDAALVAQEPIRDIAGRTGTTKSALDRHRQHVAAGLVKAKEAKETARADSLLDAVRGLAEDAHRIRRKAEKAEDLRTALDAIGKLTKIVELLVKLRSDVREAEEDAPLRFVVTMADGRMASTPAADVPVTSYVISTPAPPPPAVAPEVLAALAERPRPRREREEDPAPPRAPAVRAPRLVTPEPVPWFRDLGGL